MRDIVVSLIIVGLMPVCFRRPFIGLLCFSWLAYMRVQDLTWGFARGVRWSMYIALITIAGFVSGPKKRWFLPDPRVAILLGLVAAIGMSLLLSPEPGGYNFKRYIEYIKIVMVALFTGALVQTREHLRIMVWVISLSLGFYGIKTGLWVIFTGGGHVLQGPGGMLADNNDFSMALSMAVPMLFCVGISEKREILRRAFFFAVPLTVITVAATYSRGGFLACSAAIGLLVWRSRNRVAGLAIGALIAVTAVVLMPQSYKDRIATMTNPEEDSSASGRLRAWRVATVMATSNPLFGVGFGQFRAHWVQYCSDPTPGEISGQTSIVAHSSYFQIWAECGSIALGLYLMLIFSSLVTCWRIRKEARNRYFSSWIINYACMFEASMLAFMIGSAFLNRAHFDLFYHWVAVIMVFGHVARKEMADKTVYPERTGSRGSLAAIRPRGFAAGGGSGTGNAAPRARGFRNVDLEPRGA